MIEKLAATKHLAVVSDFDGTLAGLPMTSMRFTPSRGRWLPWSVWRSCRIPR